MTREQVVDHLRLDARLMGQTADPGVSRVEVRIALRLVRQRVMTAVVVAYGPAERAIRFGRPKHLDPGMLVWGHPLGGELPSQPAVLRGQDDSAAQACGGQRAGHAAETAAHDEDLRLLLHPRTLSVQRCGERVPRRSTNVPPSAQDADRV